MRVLLMMAPRSQSPDCLDPWPHEVALILKHTALPMNGEDAPPAKKARSDAPVAKLAPATAPEEQEDEIPWVTTGHKWVGKSLTRTFVRGRKPVKSVARVTKWVPADDEDPALWHLVHEDGDEEDLEEFEVLATLRQMARASEPTAKQQQRAEAAERQLMRAEERLMKAIAKEHMRKSRKRPDRHPLVTRTLNLIAQRQEEREIDKTQAAALFNEEDFAAAPPTKAEAEAEATAASRVQREVQNR